MHIYIAGLGHSGTTFLQLLLSSHSSAFGLGEVIQTLGYINGSKQDHPRCSCEESIYECEFWGELVEQNTRANVDLDDVFERFDDLKSSYIPIDTSKDPDYLEQYHEAGISPEEIKTIFLIRDYRGWVWSEKRRCSGREWWDRNFLIWSYKWWERNYKLEKTLEELCHDYLVVRYEDLVFSTEMAVDKILDYLELPGESLSLADQAAHDIYGNRMKNDSEKSEDLYYDDRWFTRETSWLYGGLVAPVVWKNRSYANRSLEVVKSEVAK